MGVRRLMSALGLAVTLVLFGAAAPVWANDVDSDGVDDLLDVCNNTPIGIPVDGSGRPLGDIDLDCDVDLVDYGLLQASFTGPFACVPDCTDRECGDDGCGGSCGTCESDETCLDGLCLIACNDDPECDDGLFCNGPEICQGGGCHRPTAGIVNGTFDGADAWSVTGTPPGIGGSVSFPGSLTVVGSDNGIGGFTYASQVEVELAGQVLEFDLINYTSFDQADFDRPVFHLDGTFYGLNDDGSLGSVVSIAQGNYGNIDNGNQIDRAIHFTVDVEALAGPGLHEIGFGMMSVDGTFGAGEAVFDNVLPAEGVVGPCPNQPCDEQFDVCVECLADGDCDDSLFCNGAETCGTDGFCDAGTNPCDPATQTCNESTDECVAIVEETFTLTADASATQDEGDTGTTDFTFTLSRVGGDGAAKTLDWAVSSAGGSGAAAANDFVGGAFPTGTVDYAADDFDDKTITIAVQGDSNVEPDEVFTVTVTDAGIEVATADGTITNDDSSADPVFTLPTGAGATVGQNSLITGISVSDADNSTLTVNITTSDGFLSFSAAPVATAVDGAGNAVTTANVLKDEYTLTGTITNINTTLAGFQFTTDRSASNPGTDQVAFLATDADGGVGTGTLDIAVGIQITLTAGSDTGSSFVGTTGNDVFLAGTPWHFGQGDVLDGGAGRNIVEIVTPGAQTYPTADLPAFSAVNIQEIWLNQTGAGGAPILDNFVDMPDLNTIVYSPGAANLLTINDAPNAFTLIVDTRNAAFAANIDVDIVNPVFGTQSFTLEMQGQSAAGTPLVIAAVISGTGGIETLNINSVSQNGTTAVNTITGASTINVTTLNITGDQDLVAGAWTGANTTIINASTFDGKLTVTSAINGATITGGNKDDTLNGGANAQSFSGGPGADTINPGAAADLVQTDAGADTIVVVAADVAAQGGAVVYDRWTDFTTGAGGDAMDWNTALNVDNGAVGPPFTSVNYLSAAITDTMVTGAAANVVIFEFTAATLANDIVPGTTTSATMEGWAAAALSTVDHTNAADQMLFVMYDTGTGTGLDAAIFSFSGDATLTGMVAAEFQLIAVIEGVVLNSVTAENFK